MSQPTGIEYLRTWAAAMEAGEAVSPLEAKDVCEALDEWDKSMLKTVLLDLARAEADVRALAIEVAELKAWKAHALGELAVAETLAHAVRERGEAFDELRRLGRSGDQGALTSSAEDALATAEEALTDAVANYLRYARQGGGR